MRLMRNCVVLQDQRVTCITHEMRMFLWVVDAKALLEQALMECFSSPFNLEPQRKENEPPCKYVELSAAEESFKKKKAWVQWLALCDQNTKFSTRI